MKINAWTVVQHVKAKTTVHVFTGLRSEKQAREQFVECGMEHYREMGVLNDDNRETYEACIGALADTEYNVAGVVIRMVRSTK